jgi:CRISPR system Cascade subunit CasB
MGGKLSKFEQVYCGGKKGRENCKYIKEHTMERENKATSKAEAFVETVIKKLKGPDTSFGAILRRADNPATEYQSWEFLCRWCRIDKNRERKPYALIGAALARVKPEADGSLGIGQAIARCYSSEGAFDGNKQPAARAKFRRLLACNSAEEVCTVLRPLLGLIASRKITLNYAGLLQDLLSGNKLFDHNEWFNEKIKTKWAQDFYYKKEDE